MKSFTIQTHSGRYVDLAKFSHDDVYLGDIAWALARNNRYNGHTQFQISVAQHCVMLADYFKANDFPMKLVRAALMHDAQEAYIGDIAAPIKWLFPVIKEWENGFEQTIAEKFGLEWPYPEELHYFDKVIRNDEMRAAMKVWPEEGPFLDVKVEKWSAHAAQEEWLDRFYRYIGAGPKSQRAGAGQVDTGPVAAPL